MALSVVVADDDRGVRAAEVELLRTDSRFEVVAAVGTADDAIDAVRTHRPDFVVLDIRMPGGGLYAARAIRDSDCDTVVVVMSVTIDAALLVDLLRAGVRGAILKGRGTGLLPELLAHCVTGEVVLLVPSAAQALAHLTRTASPGPGSDQPRA